MSEEGDPVSSGKGPRWGVHFHASWWYENYGQLFDMEHYKDPFYQLEWSRKRPVILDERFPGKGFYQDPEEQTPWTGGFGVTTVPQLMGCKVRYHPNDEPFALPDLNIEASPSNNLDDDDINPFLW